MDNKNRCSWVSDEELYIRYHDNEWAQPIFLDEELFKSLTLESFQSGLSWITILRKRENFIKAFSNFDIEKVALYTNEDVKTLLQNEGIIRHRGKIEATINNAKRILEIQKEHGSFSSFIWKYVDNTPVVGHWNSEKLCPSKTDLSDKISNDLKKLGFKFVGSTTIYSFMQASGMVFDHSTDCFKYQELLKNK